MRVRFAPSPTGYLHIGNARTVLFNYLFARKNRGTFILRIEDTDRERSKTEYIEQIYRDLRWLGIEWDEGPDVGGEYGPYLQSERLSLHKEYVKKLIDNGNAYYCYCTPEELEARREERRVAGAVGGYDGRCRNLSEEAMAEKHAAGILPSVRFKMQEEGELVVDDLIRGEVHFDGALQSDFIIMRPDGTPTFHLAVSVDDGLMRVSHVLRGEDHLSNTPKHIMIMKACGFPVPRYAHMPLTMGPGGEPLSKRFGAMSIREYRQLGYRNEALCNYMALLGWNPGDDREFFPLEELKKVFSVKRISKSPAVFDKAKLDWMAGMHIRALDDNAYIREAVTYLLETGLVSNEDYSGRPEWYAKVLLTLKDYLACYADLKEQLMLFRDEIIGEESDILKTPEAQKVLQVTVRALEEHEYIDENTFDALLKHVKKESKQKGKALFAPLRIALTGKEHGPDLKMIMILLGKKLCKQRLEACIHD